MGVVVFSRLQESLGTATAVVGVVDLQLEKVGRGLGLGSGLRSLGFRVQGLRFRV